MLSTLPVNRFLFTCLTLASLSASALPALATQTGASSWQDISDGYKVTWSPADLRAVPVKAPDRIVFSAKQTAKIQFGHMHEDQSHCLETREFRLLSLVGSIMSYADSTNGTCQDTQHPFGETEYVAINLRQGGIPAKLTDIFFPEDIYKALIADKVIQKALEQSGAQPENFDQLEEAFANGISVSTTDAQRAEPLCFKISSDFLNHFAFHHIDSNKVWVRIGLAGTDDCRSQLTEIGITLPMPQSLQEELTAADLGRHGVLMKDTDRRARIIHTSFSFASSNEHKRTARATK